jgi:hypothetical protein
MKKLTLTFLILTLLYGCDFKRSMEKHNKAKKLADNIIEKLDDPSIYNEFPEKYFPIEQLKPILDDLIPNCDWKNRDVKFVDFVTIETIGGVDQTGFIYEYYLSCDSLRFILMFNMETENPELRGLLVEPLEKENKLIIYPSKQLKNRESVNKNNPKNRESDI